jgi:hypothetical protein
MRDLLFAQVGGVLEVRASKRGGGRRLRGRFPYKRRAVLTDGGRNGRPQKEEFAERAFEFRVNDPAAEIHLLAGHSYDKPLASKLSGTLTLTDTPEALHFEAEISDTVAAATHVRDALALLAGGLATGISPGFRLPPERAVPKDEAEEWIDEEYDPDNGMHRAKIRRIKQALLFELSIVTAPAYRDAQVTADDEEEEDDDLPPRKPIVQPKPKPIVRPTLAETVKRWR